MIKATDLKNYIFEKPMKNGCRNLCHYLIFVLKKYFLHFFNLFWHFFSTLPSTQTKKVIDLIIGLKTNFEKSVFHCRTDKFCFKCLTPNGLTIKCGFIHILLF